MKGRIGVVSQPGKGSTFWFVLPLRRLESTGSLELPSAESDSALAPLASSKKSSRKILVAEDNPINQEVIREVLSDLGYEADIVENGELALRALEQQAYPLALVDCQMPELDGYAAAREIRRREGQGERMPLIAVTAHALEGERQKALSAGMDDYVTKPVSSAQLAAVIERWWPKRHFPEPESGERLASVRPPPAPAEALERAAVLDPAVKRSAAVAKVFLKYVPGQLDALGAALTGGNSEALRAAAHKLKGSCSMVGVPRMAEVCAALEAGESDSAALFAELRGLYAAAERELNAEIERAQKAAS
jgi:CheY-like chemotaxis protein/HPt (histidine-containing phosphotransfer) domain-containing protein